MGLSEGLFVALCALTLVALTWWMDDGHRHRTAPWLAALAIGAAIHVRYTGVFLVPVHAACAWCVIGAQRSFHGRAKGASTRAEQLTGPFFAAVSVSAGPALGSLFLVQRYVSFGCGLCQPRLPSTRSLVMNVRDVAIALVKSLPAVYELVPGPLDAVISLGVVVLVMLVLAKRRGAVTPPTHRAATLAIAVAFSTVYLVGMLCLGTVIEFNSLDPRLLAPSTFVWLAIGLAAAFDRMAPTSRIRAAGILIIMFAAAGGVAAQTVPWRGLSDPSLRQLSVVRYATQHVQRSPEVPLFCNEATIVQAQVGYEVPLYFLPDHGVPALGPSGYGVAVMRPTPATAARVAELDAVAPRIAETPDLIAWALDYNVVRSVSATAPLGHEGQSDGGIRPGSTNLQGRPH
jgi:hypothetical protein